LVRAITSENFELVEILVTKGSDIYQEDLYGTGLLIHSALYGDHRALKFLLSKGLDPNPPLRDGLTALQACIFRQEIQKIKLLLDNGADVHARGKMESTAPHPR
jgi:ankyrin repeat protein